MSDVVPSRVRAGLFGTVELVAWHRRGRLVRPDSSHAAVGWMMSTWTVEDGKALWDGRRLDQWIEVLVADLVTESTSCSRATFAAHG